MFPQFGSIWKLVGESAQRTRKYYSAQILHGHPSILHQQRRSNLTFFSRQATLPTRLEGLAIASISLKAIAKSNQAPLQSIWAPKSTDTGSCCITPSSGGGGGPSRPTDQLVKTILSSQDMKRVIGRELRKCGGHVDHLNYSRMVYDAWSGYTEQIILTHIESKERLIQLIHEAMNEDPTFRAYIENVLNDRLRNRPMNMELPGGKNVSWIILGASLLAAFFNFYFTALVLFAGAAFLTFYY